METMFRSGRLAEWLSEVVKADRETKNWEVWLHRIRSEDTYEAWKRKNNLVEQVETVDKKVVAEAISSSRSILGSFNPQQG